MHGQLRRTRQGEIDPERAARTDGALHADDATHQFDQSFGHHQANARAFFQTGFLAETIERLEKLRQLFHSQSRTAIPDTDAQCIRRKRRALHGDRAGRPVVLDGIAEKIFFRLLDDEQTPKPVQFRVPLCTGSARPPLDTTNMRTRPYWLHDLQPLKPDIWLVLLGIAGCVPMLLWMLTSTAMSADVSFNADFGHTPTESTVSVLSNCPECGVVSSRREIAGANPGIEVTVRMKDGSERQFADASSSIWRVGERMIIIESTNQADD